MQNANLSPVSTSEIMPEVLKRFARQAHARGSLRKLVAQRGKFFPEEERMTLYGYYRRYPLCWPDDAVLKYINEYGKLRPEQAIRPEGFLKHLDGAGYTGYELGYCQFPDGSGYVAAYGIRPENVTREMELWYRDWSTYYSQSMVPGHGNLRYKLANPACHFDNRYVNRTDDTLGIVFQECIGLSGEDRVREVIRHPFRLTDYGLTEEDIAALNRQGVVFDGKAYYETFDEPGTNLCFSYERPCPLGGTEVISRKWIGWRPIGGRLVRDPLTQCSEEYLKQVLIHMIVEREQLYAVLPELYEEYCDLPLNAD